MQNTNTEIETERLQNIDRETGAEGLPNVDTETEGLQNIDTEIETEGLQSKVVLKEWWSLFTRGLTAPCTSMLVYRV